VLRLDWSWLCRRGDRLLDRNLNRRRGDRLCDRHLNRRRGDWLCDRSLRLLHSLGLGQR